MNKLTTVRKSSREVGDAKRRLEGIVDSAMDAIITIDERNNIVLFNPAAENMFGVARGEAIGEPISRFIPQRFRAGHDEHIERFRRTGVTGRSMGALGAISGLRADNEEFPIEASISQVDIGGERLATVILRDITERRANEEARLMLAREVDHRAKNALAVVQALVALTTAPTTEAFVAAIRGRIAALARAHSLLAQNRWKGGDLSDIVREEAAAYGKPGQIHISGPDLALGPDAVQPISLILHELATNAVKYGALSQPEGRVDLSWEIDAEGKLIIQWAESGGPPVVEPSTRGFGSTLITTMGAKQLGGEISMDWRGGGIVVHAALPKESYRSDQLRQGPPQLPEDGRRERASEGRLLIVEDETLVALELSKAMQDSGWDVMGPASTLEEAFRLLAGGEQPDAAVLDVNLHGEMVYPLADLLETRGVPFLFCSGYEMLNHGNRYRHSPIVRKPTSFALLMAELRKIVPIGAKGPAPQLA
jgi:PAS domain S-box-containing protein